MKKHIITLIFALGFGMSLSAQGDGFFTTSYSEFRTDSSIDQQFGLTPAMPGHGYALNQPAPVGSGLLILGGLALAYGLRKKD